MILSGAEIEELNLVEPFQREKTVRFGLTGGCSGHSYDAHFGRFWGTMTIGAEIDIAAGVIPDDAFRWIEDDTILLRPGMFILATTAEHVYMPADICAAVVDKSTWARLGLSAANTFIDPGFHGSVTLELVNNGSRALVLHAGQPAVQLVFARAERSNVPYNGRYQGQNGLVGPILAR